MGKKREHRLNDFLDDNSGRKPWTVKEKQKLLKGLRKYGHMDIHGMCKVLPGRTPGSIKAKINEYASRIRGKGDDLSPLETWLKSDIFQERDSIIPQALKLIQLFEKHPPSEKCAGCDFRQ
ncbi:uncharacterized protein LOC105703534 isoform X3 [Orussus abietinus]|uniref:uncharacterized protein LOC105703534 isoform X3 n=1 Tax=Orussus abietinus TaxID=222816 RepID=UPI0006261D93|nr:uncharacterized protein LOC105703534 isoform X3 [Orussus abietinus]